MQNSKEKIRYNFELLKTIIDRDKPIINEVDYKDINLNRDSKIKFICKCGKEGCEKTFRYIFEEGGAFCKACTKKNSLKKAKATNLKNLGVEYAGQSKQVKEKAKATNLEKYGVENVFQSKETKEKVKATNLEKFGVENPSQSKEIKDKVKATNLEKFVVENPSNSKEIKDKVKATYL
jgi:hypothetical protein